MYPLEYTLIFFRKYVKNPNEIGLSMIHWWIQLIIYKIIVKSYTYLGHIYVTQGAELCIKSIEQRAVPFLFLLAISPFSLPSSVSI